MPRLVLQILRQRLDRTGLLDRAVNDARLLFRKRLQLLPEGEEATWEQLSVELKIGAVVLGHLTLSPRGEAVQEGALRRWLQWVGQDMSDSLSMPHAHEFSAMPKSIVEAARFIREHHHEGLTLASVAAVVKLSRERLSRLFHETMGITFSEYLNHARLEAARPLLRQSSMKVTDIAYESGFQSLSQFHRRFRAAEGCSPLEYRERGKSQSGT
ncbi:AraC family transcriptional regulator [Pelagicoccus sp. SDUM812003]|uniref:helix-turn-helix transcriptional regulator n=1 Tax=Pelagicoccus sp. SDUM812003 TaxID=3041267 RepID=UPI00280CA8E4|nr:AraC family transcriptional regulator [Pelagicoccus sp. SDUM812003]MDQ8204277.1 AraC family transcriptional regulator [Pelagicoccus sp. SDUM812003]